DGNTHTVTIYIKSPEQLTNVVEWSLEPTDDVYNGAFDSLNYNTLDVELNNGDLDWSEGSIEMDELTIRDSYSQNKFVFTWTEGVAPEPSPEQPFFIPTWVAVLIVAMIVILIVAYFYYKNE
ncbi:MAG: hypothetical protein ACOC80_13320, partial [Petrotogales bacterium]